MPIQLRKLPPDAHVAEVAPNARNVHQPLENRVEGLDDGFATFLEARTTDVFGLLASSEQALGFTSPKDTFLISRGGN